MRMFHESSRHNQSRRSPHYCAETSNPASTTPHEIPQPCRAPERIWAIEGPHSHTRPFPECGSRTSYTVRDTRQRWHVQQMRLRPTTSQCTARDPIASGGGHNPHRTALAPCIGRTTPAAVDATRYAAAPRQPGPSHGAEPTLAGKSPFDSLPR